MKCLLLFSGGLDSILAAKVLQKQNIEVTGLALAGYFFSTDQARKSAEKIGMELIEEDLSREHLEIVKNPKYGYGSGMNPCVDCHLFMLKEAHRIFKEKGFDMLATGEVLGQRPFSQNKQAFQRIEKYADLEKMVLRPLSAKLLEDTVYENRGMIDKDKLEDIEGRSRKRQIELAKEFGIAGYPSPAGGCILTEKEFSDKLRDLLKNENNIEENDIELIKLGRHFWSERGHIILGRNKKENELLEKLVQKDDLIIEPENFKGPTALVRGKISEKIKSKTQTLIKNYSKNIPSNPKFSYKHPK